MKKKLLWIILVLTATLNFGARADDWDTLVEKMSGSFTEMATDMQGVFESRGIDCKVEYNYVEEPSSFIFKMNFPNPSDIMDFDDSYLNDIKEAFKANYIEGALIYNPDGNAIQENINLLKRHNSTIMIIYSTEKNGREFTRAVKITPYDLEAELGKRLRR